MSVLRSLENKIAGLVEGTFSRAFRSEVRPVEIARKLAREMEEHKSFSVSRTYAPERVPGVPVAARSRALRRLRGRSGRGAGRLPARARAPRAPGAARRARSSSSRPTIGSGSGNSGSRPGWPRRRGRRTDEAPAEQSGPDHGLQHRRARRGAARGARTRPRADGAAGARRQAHGGRAGRRDHRAQPAVRHRASTTRTSRASTPRSARGAAPGCFATSGPPTGHRSTAAGSTAPRCSSRATRSSSARRR